MKNLLTFLMLFLSTAAVAQVDIKMIQSSISNAHANWTASDTWSSQFSEKEIHHLLGLKSLPVGQLDFKPLHIDASTSLDWRNVNGVDWLGKVMNQGNCGSCVAFATIATLEAQTSITQGIPWMTPSFSPQMLFACGGGGCESGWDPDSATSFLMSTGVTDEACMPYTEGSTGEDADCSQKCSTSASRTTTLKEYTNPTSEGGDVETVKAALKNGPLITTLSVYDDFLTYTSGVYKHVHGSLAGGHAVSLVGFDDAKQAWLIRNSWGPEWGLNGFAWVSWDDVSGIGANTWALKLPSSDVLAVVSPSDREIVSGKYTLALQQKSMEVTAAKVTISGSKTVTLDCASTCSLDTSTLPEGRYEISAQNGSMKSQVREFFVLNSVPKMTLSFTPTTGIDLSQPVTGRPTFNVQAGFGAVPIEHLEFRAVDKTGAVVSIKSNNNILANMVMGWRSTTVPNGKYTINFHGETHYLGKMYSVDSNSYSIKVAN